MKRSRRLIPYEDGKSVPNLIRPRAAWVCEGGKRELARDERSEWPGEWPGESWKRRRGAEENERSPIRPPFVGSQRVFPCAKELFAGIQKALAGALASVGGPERSMAGPGGSLPSRTRPFLWGGWLFRGGKGLSTASRESGGTSKGNLDNPPFSRHLERPAPLYVSPRTEQAPLSRQTQDVRPSGKAPARAFSGALQPEGLDGLRDPVNSFFLSRGARKWSTLEAVKAAGGMRRS